MQNRRFPRPRASGALCVLAAILLQPTAAAIGENQKKDQSAAAAPAPAVLVVPAGMRALGQQTVFIGRVEAFLRVDVRARVSGFLREQRFTPGSQVKDGDVLYLIEPEPFEAALAQRQAQVAAAIATQENAIASLKRYQVLESKQVASEATLDLKIAEEKRATASIMEAKAAQQEAEIQLSYTKIVAPFAGRVGRSAIDPGNLVGPDSGVLTTVVRTDKMYALFPVTQAQLLESRKTGGDATNLKVRARLADGSLLPEVGEIDFVDVKVDSRTDGQIVRAVFPNPHNLLSDGQTVRLVIERKDPDTALSIPTAAISTDQAGPYVFVVSADGTAQQRRLKLGVSRDGYIAVIDGVKEGELVVVQGLQKVRDGVKVTATTSDGGLSSQSPSKRQGDAK